MWAVRSLSESDCVPSLYETLSSNELQRAAAFRFEPHKNHYIAARGLLRVILGAYVGKAAKTLRFRYGPQGKPYLCGTENCRLQFNLSHSEDSAVYALALDCELGIDVERIKELPEMDSVARRFFSQAEVADLRAVPPELRAQAFYRCWTRKEAYVKAVGSGLSVALDQFQVSLLPGQPAALLNLQNDPDSVSCWSMYDLHSWDGFVSAVAIRSPTCSMVELKFATATECLKRLQ